MYSTIGSFIIQCSSIYISIHVCYINTCIYTNTSIYTHTYAHVYMWEIISKLYSEKHCKQWEHYEVKLFSVSFTREKQFRWFSTENRQYGISIGFVRSLSQAQFGFTDPQDTDQPPTTWTCLKPTGWCSSSATLISLSLISQRKDMVLDWGQCLALGGLVVLPPVKVEGYGLENTLSKYAPS